MNSCICYVDKIWSYQRLINKNGRFTYPSKNYKPYREQMYEGMKTLKPIPKDVPIRIELVLNVKNGVQEKKWVVKMKSTDNTSKLCDSEEEALAYYDKEKHYIEERDMVISYGSVPDTDNATKAIVDTLELFEIIDNDRNVVFMDIKNTFNNKEESIEITLEELKPYVNESKVVEFKSK